MRKMRKLISLCLLGLILLSGCSMEKNDVEKVRDLDFTVLEDKEIPEELKAVLEEKKAKEFKMTYEDGQSLYIIVGYGEQNTGGYSIAVKELYLSSNAIYISTNLIGPSKEDLKTETKTYPFVVIKTEYIEKSVVFQ